MLRQPALAESMAEVVAGGEETFYRGKLGDRMCEGIASAGGLISREDLASYKATWSEPISTTYRGLDVRVPPPNSAGFQILETLNILDGYGPLEYGTPETLHLLIEAVLAAADDRVLYAGDPDLVDIPLERLLSSEYAEQVRSRIDPNRANAPPKERFRQIADRRGTGRGDVSAGANARVDDPLRNRRLGRQRGYGYPDVGRRLWVGPLRRAAPECSSTTWAGGSTSIRTAGALTSSARANGWTSAYLRCRFFQGTRLS